MCMVVLPTHGCVRQNVESCIDRQIQCTSMTFSIVYFVSIVSKVNVSITDQCGIMIWMAPPSIAKLLLKLLVPVKIKVLLVSI